MEEKVMRSNYCMHLDYSVPLGETWTKFMLGLKGKKIYGNRCSKCGRMYVPPQPFCPICYKKIEDWVETSGEGIVVSFCITYQKFMNLPEPPFTLGIIRVDDSATCMMHRMGGIKYEHPEDLPDKITIGMKVKPVWAEERKGEILDIAYFKPV